MACEKDELAQALRKRRRERTLNHMSCRSRVGAVNWISRFGVLTMMLPWWRPGGKGLGSRT